MTERKVLIIKSNGEEEIFNPDKLRASLRRAGARKGIAESITETVASKLKNGATTNEIYRQAFRLLNKQEDMPVAARYSVKRAVFELGPSGFPFEHFVAEIFRAKGYEVRNGDMVRGACALHEVDLVAKKGSHIFGGEVKFHNRLGTKTDLKTALYVYARFDDIKRNSAALPDKSDIDEGMLITNTKFTENAIVYAECAGLKMLSWDYPQKGNLFELIGETGLHPITCLTTLSRGEKQRLLEDKVILCKTLKQNPDILKKQGISGKKIEHIIEETGALCQPGTGV